MPVVVHDDEEADVVLESTAETLLLRLWGRPCGEVFNRGAGEVATAWLALGGA